MMKRAIRVGLVIVAFAAFVSPSPGSNGTIQGTVFNPSNERMRGTMRVQAYTRGDRDNWVAGPSTLVNTNGVYALSLPPGQYKLLAREGLNKDFRGFSPESGLTCSPSQNECRHPTDDRYWRQEMWYPSALTERQAGILDLKSGESMASINFYLPQGAAVRGRVSAGGTYKAGLSVRVEMEDDEMANDFERHHYATTMSGRAPYHNARLGEFRARGLRSGYRHRAIAHDPDGYFETRAYTELFPATSGVFESIGNLNLPAYLNDPWADHSTLGTALDIGRASFSHPHGPQPWQGHANSRIAPRNEGKVNWVCWDAYRGDRFIVSATTKDLIPDMPAGRFHPWVDPMIKVVWRDNEEPVHPQAIDHDSGRHFQHEGLGPLCARVDTSQIEDFRKLCVAVTTYGDANFLGMNQQSAGRYRLQIKMGNRPPQVDIFRVILDPEPDHPDDVPVQNNPVTIAMGEGHMANIWIEFQDPDNAFNELAVNAELTGPNGQPVTDAHFVTRNNTVAQRWEGEWTWTAPLIGEGAYTLAFTVDDGEFDARREVTLMVGAVNYAPTRPTLVTPMSNETVETRTPTLVFDKSEDPDGPTEDLTYEIELFHGETFDASLGADIAYTDVPHGLDDGGVIQFTVDQELPEKQYIWWRVRADDGEAENNFSPWSEPRRFYVHAIPPEIEAYVAAETVEHQDTLEVWEGDTLSIDLVYRAPHGSRPMLTSSFTDAFGEPFVAIPGLAIMDVEGTEGAANWTWVVGALDSAGSPYSLRFTANDTRLRTHHDVLLVVHERNLPPTAPIMIEPEDESLVEDLLPLLAAQNASDPEGEDVFMHFQVATDPAFEVIVAETPAMQLPQDVEGVTSWTVDPRLGWDTDYWVRAYAKDVHGLAGPFSDAHRFRTPENVSPTTPQPIAPEDGVTLETLNPTVEFSKSVDPDGVNEDLTYDVELWFSLDDTAAHTVFIDIPHGADDDGTITRNVGPIPEKQTVWWRVRANDHQSQYQYSEWSEFWAFTVHAIPPEIEAYLGEEPLPEFIDVDEGDTLVVDLAYRAPNGPAPLIEEELRDVHGRRHVGNYELEVLPDTAGEGEAVWTWWVGALDAARSPYTLRFTVDDGRYQRAISYGIDVGAKNLAPTAPVLLEPEPGEVIMTRTPTIRATNAVDPEGESVAMHFEVASDEGFGSAIVARTLPAGIPQASDAQETSWVVDPQLDWAREYWVRAYATDVHGLRGPNSATHAFRLRQNRPPGSSEFMQCEDGMVVTDNPFIVPISHGTDPDGDSVFIHAVIFPFGDDPADGYYFDRKIPVASGDVTDLEIDLGVIPTNTRYLMRIRSYDGAHYSDWDECEFWSNVRNHEAQPLRIVKPAPGHRLPLDTSMVTVEVENAFDIDLVVPGTTLEIAWCASRDPEFSDCPALEAEWNRVAQSSFDPNDTTTFDVDGIGNREAWYIKACALDESNLCGPADTTWVLAGDPMGADAPSGCCTTARGGDPWLALFAVFAIALLAPRPRRRLA